MKDSLSSGICSFGLVYVYTTPNQYLKYYSWLMFCSGWKVELLWIGMNKKTNCSKKKIQRTSIIPKKNFGLIRGRNEKFIINFLLKIQTIYNSFPHCLLWIDLQIDFIIIKTITSKRLSNTIQSVYDLRPTVRWECLENITRP